MSRGIRLMLTTALGFGYGVALLFLGFIATGAGHGTYVLLGLFSAPLSLAENIVIALAGTPFLWALAGFLAGGPWRWASRALFLVTMAAHYGSAYWVLNGPSTFADWSYVPRVGGLFWLGLSIYGVGQVALWGLVILHFWFCTNGQSEAETGLATGQK